MSREVGTGLMWLTMCRRMVRKAEASGFGVQRLKGSSRAGDAFKSTFRDVQSPGNTNGNIWVHCCL